MQRFNKTVSAKRIYKDKEDYRFDSIIQRNFVWDELKKSIFIHSMMIDFPIPPMFAQENPDSEKQLFMLDGKQRLSTVVEFLGGELTLHKDTPPVENIEVAGMNYDALPDDLKDNVKDYSFLVYFFKGMTDAQRDELFLRLNGGKPLTRIELTRVEAGVDFMEYIRELAKNPFFNNQFTEKQKDKFANEEVVLQCVNLIYNDGVDGFSGKVISNMVTDLKQTPLSQQQQEAIQNTVEYLNVAFPEKEKFLKKVNIPIIFSLALQYMKDLTATEFFYKVKTFFESPTDEYTEAARVGSAKPEAIATRLSELEEFITQDITQEQQDIEQEQKDREEQERLEELYYQDEQEQQEEGQQDIEGQDTEQTANVA